MPGRFVVLEGGDGSGKSTQAAHLAAGLRQRGVAVCETFEPGATGAGAVMRELLLHSREAIAPTTEALLMAADRAQHVAEQIAPALAAGNGSCATDTFRRRSSIRGSSAASGWTPSLP